MNYDEELKAANDANVAASRAFREVEDRQDAAARAAAAEAKATFSAEIAIARQAVIAAERARNAIQNRAPEHEWTGKRVVRKVPTGPWSREYIDQFGVVEMMKTHTVRPANTPPWRAPQLGSAIVRVLKKDGKPGARFEHLGRDWTLATGAA